MANEKERDQETLNAAIRRLEAAATAPERKAAAEVQAAQRELAPVVEEAHALLRDFASLSQEYGSQIERLFALDFVALTLLSHGSDSGCVHQLEVAIKNARDALNGGAHNAERVIEDVPALDVSATRANKVAEIRLTLGYARTALETFPKLWATVEYHAADVAARLKARRAEVPTFVDIVHPAEPRQTSYA